jgi:hypothetical protein
MMEGMEHSSLKLQLGLVLLVLCITRPLFADPTKKNSASSAGLEAAKKDVQTLKISLKKKSPEQLVESFIPTAEQRYGGYEYFYKYMANIAIREELASRGKSAEPTLRANRSNKTRIWEAVNGPGDTIGRICTKLLDKLTKLP